jgi:hypothetical protein
LYAKYLDVARINMKKFQFHFNFLLCNILSRRIEQIMHIVVRVCIKKICMKITLNNNYNAIQYVNNDYHHNEPASRTKKIIIIGMQLNPQKKSYRKIFNFNKHLFII